jgi:hypothetical protein
MTATPPRRKPAGITILGKEPPPPPAAPVAVPATAPAKPEAEPGTRFSLYLSVEAGAALKILAAELSRSHRRTITVQDVLRGAVDRMFIANGKPPIAGGPTDLVE